MLRPSRYRAQSTKPKTAMEARTVLQLSLAIAFSLLVLFPSGALAQSVTQYTLNEGSGGGNDINATTACTNPVVKSITVGDSFTITNVSIGAFITHGWRGDINIRLRSPAGTEVQIVNGNLSGGSNFNVLLDDSHSSVVNSDPFTFHSSTAPNPPITSYQHDYSPNNALSTFNGENSLGTWQLRICDLEPTIDDGNFQRADLYLTDTAVASSADLSLTKTVSNTNPVNGTNVTYSLTVTNSASSASTATGIAVQDILPTGVSYVSSSGTGIYNNITGIWAVGSLAPGASATVGITVTVTAFAGVTIVNSAEISASGLSDPDSVPANGSIAEDDDDTASFVVSGGRAAGTPPTLICPNGNTIFDWDTVIWTAGSTTGSYAVANLGNISFSITNQGVWLNNATYGGQSPARQNIVDGSFTGQNSLFQLTDMANQSEEAVTTITLPTAVDGAQFTIFDVDHNPGGFADQIVVTGSYNGATVMPVVTNGIANFVVGNSAFGDALSSDSQPNGNVVVTFSSPVDVITIIYTNHNLAPVDPAQQAIALHDITFCIPVANLSVNKTSTILSDGISASNPKAIPGAIVRYCLLVSNTGSADATGVIVSDTIPADLTFVANSLQSSDSCSGTMTVEDDNSTGVDENDPVGMSFNAGMVTGSANSLALGESVAMIFTVTIE